MLKMALFDCAINEKCYSVDGGRGICPLFSSPPGGTWQLKSPHRREFAIQGKKNANVRGSARGGGGLGAGGIDWCITICTLALGIYTRLFSSLEVKNKLCYDRANTLSHHSPSFWFSKAVSFFSFSFFRFVFFYCEQYSLVTFFFLWVERSSVVSGRAGVSWFCCLFILVLFSPSILG